MNLLRNKVFLILAAPGGLACLMVAARSARVRTRLWHLTHRSVIHVDDYELRIPENWVVTRSIASDPNLGSLSTVSLESSIDVPAVSSNPGISLVVYPPGKLHEDWLNRAAEEMEKQSGKVNRIVVASKNEHFDCIYGAQLLPNFIRGPSRSFGLYCISPGGLLVGYGGPQSKSAEVYEFIGHIEKVSR